jgi:hypothetical protein
VDTDNRVREVLTPLPVLFILAVLWAVVLVPPLLRSRSQRTADSIVDFNYKLDVLGQTNGHLEIDNASAAGAPRAHIPTRPLVPALHASAVQRSARRRRDVVRVLSGSITVTLILAAMTNSPVAWTLQILVDVFALAYLGLWAWLRSTQFERAEKVHYMPERRAPELVLRRSVSASS